MAMFDLGKYGAEIVITDKGFTKGLNDAEKSMEGLEKKSGAFASALSKTVVGAVVAVGAAIGATAIKGVKDFAHFEKQMNEVFTLLPDISETAMKDMEKQVKDFSKEFGKLPSDVVPALYQSLSAGVPQDNVFDFLEVANKAAVGGVTDLNTAVDGLTSVVNAYGSEIIDASTASDLMFTAVKNGKTTFEEMSSSLYNVIPTASSLGLGFENVTAAIASMTAMGTPTAQATTQMRQLLVELSKDGGKASDTFKELSGKSFKDFVAEGGNVQDALKLMERAAHDNNIGINDLFSSVEAGNAALSLTGKGTDAFSKNLEDMTNSAGATDTAFDTMNRGISASWEQMKATLSVFVLEIGERLAPAISTFADFVRDVMPQVQHYVEIAFDAISFAVEFLVNVFNGLITYIKQMSDTNGDTFEKMAKKINEVFSSIREFFEVYIAILSNLWDKYGENILNITEVAFEQVKNTIDLVFGVISGIFQTVTGLLQGDWSKMGEGLEKITTSIWTFIEKTFKNALNLLVNIVKLSGGLLLDAGKFAMNLLWDGFKQIWNSITRWFDQIMSNLFSFFTSKYSTFENIGADMFSSIWDGMKGIWSSLSSWVSDKVSWLTDKLLFWRNGQSEMNSDGGSPSKTSNSTIGGIPAYSQGTPWVPSTGLALIHQGEMIVPKEHNPFNSNGQLKSGGAVKTGENVEEHHYHFNNLTIKTDNAETFLDGIRFKARSHKR